MNYKVQVLSSDGSYPIFKSEGVGGIFTAMSFVVNLLSKPRKLTITIESEEE